MSSAESRTYRVLGTIDLSGQTSPYTVADADVNPAYEIMLFLKTERGTLSGVSVQNITSGSFQVVFNASNDSIYTYYGMPSYKYGTTPSPPVPPIPPSPTTRTINFQGSPTFSPPEVNPSQTLTLGSFSIDSTRTCTSCVLSFTLFVATFPTVGSLFVRIKDNLGNIIDTISNPSLPTLTWAVSNNHLNSTNYNTTGSTRTFSLELFNNSGDNFIVLDESAVFATLVAQYNP
jgi:hypothetical protein